jgi:hypothetical protein
MKELLKDLADPRYWITGALAGLVSIGTFTLMIKLFFGVWLWNVLS